MKSPLRILHLEDDPHDAELVNETLASEGITSEVTRVETEADFVAALRRVAFDLIVADYTLPSFDGLSALKIAQQDWPQVPFIFVSGTLGEEVAIEALKFGATDYVFKTRLFRIVPSVRRALREAEERSELRRSEAALRLSEAYLTEAQKISRTGSFGWNTSTGEVYWSEETFRIFGYDPAAGITLERVIERIHPEDRAPHVRFLERVSQERREWNYEHRLLLPDGSVKYVRVIGHPSQDASRGFEFVGAITDVTELKRSDEEMRKFASLVENGTDFIGMASLEGEVLFVNAAGQAMLGMSGDAHVRKTRISEYIAEENLERFMSSVLPLAFKDGRWEGETLFKHFKTGASIPVWQHIFFITEEGSGHRLALATICRDVTERMRAEEGLRRSERKLAQAQKLTHSGSWAVAVPGMENIYWSQEMFRIFGLNPSPNPPSYMEVARSLLHPEDAEYHAVVQQAIRDKTDYETEYRLVFPDGSIKYIRAIGHPIVNASGEVVELVGTAMDVTEQNEARAALETAFAEIKKLRDQLFKENIALRDEIDKASMFEEIVGESPALQAVLARVARVAPTDSSVLITGETGTGKELIARAIHKRSHRSSRAFVSVNCAAIPTTLIASELFGHEKGAFTGALNRRLGRFELAEGGTIFLDEIGELPAETQIALLRIFKSASSNVSVGRR